jgi:hypothetical protein
MNFHLRRGYGGQAAAAAAALMVLAVGVPVFAQSSEGPSLRRHHVMLGAGLAWSGAYDIGVATAQLRGNGPSATPPPFTLFRTDSHFTKTTMPDVRVGIALTRRLAFEAGASLSHPHIGVRIAGDAEAPSQALLGEELEQYLFEGGMTWQPPIAFGRNLAPFVSVGAGYLRQLHEDRTLAETGEIYYAGGGARYWLRGRSGATKALGIRADARLNVRTRGIDFEDKMRTYPTFSLALFVGL